jgi:probable rRNA maturation factor
MEPGSTGPLELDGSGGAFAAGELRVVSPQGELMITEPRWHRYVPNLARVVGRAMGLTGCPANVVLTDDRTIRRLNARDRGKNKPTNVLTYEQPPEILLALGVVRREATAERKSVSDHLSHLLVHGSLHLAGYDHIHSGDARRMEQAEARLLAVLKIPNPWKHK